MKYAFLIFLLLITATVACGQQQDICSHLRASGRVLIQQDSRLNDLVGTSPKTYYAHSVGTAANGGSAQVMGYRIRIYSGNQQTVSKNRCYSIQAHIKSQMPEIPTYVNFKSPNWRISVGDYRSSEEAHSSLHQLKEEFPAYAKEMFVVQEKINIQ